MNAILVVLISLLSSFSLLSQRFNPVEWDFSAQHIEGKEYRLFFKAKVAPGWYIYSQFLDGDSGPIPTSLFFDASPKYQLEGKASETGKREEGFDPIFDMEVVKFSGNVILIQKVILDENPAEIKGFLEYMTCNDETCLPPKEVPFSFKF